MKECAEKYKKNVLSILRNVPNILKSAADRFAADPFLPHFKGEQMDVPVSPGFPGDQADGGPGACEGHAV